HIPESLEGVSMRVIRAGGESGLGITDVVNGTDEGGRILDEALSNSQTVDEIEKQANFDARCASATGGGETPAALVSSEAPCYDASGRIHEVPLPLTK